MATPAGKRLFKGVLQFYDGESLSHPFRGGINECISHEQAIRPPVTTGGFV